MDYSFLTGCASQFWQITSGVCRAVTACLGGGGRPATLAPDLVMACYERVNRARTKLLALMERVRAGRMKVFGSRTGSVSPAMNRIRLAVARAIKLPRRFGWLVHLVGYQAAGHASQLSHLLGDPEMVALVRDVPQARRILAPLCRMLGVECAALHMTPRVRRPMIAQDSAITEGLVPEVGDSKSLVLARPDYRPSARWPRGVITRGPGRFKST